MASEQTTSDANNAQIGMEQEMEIQVEEDDELAAQIRNTRGPTTCGKLDRLLKKDGPTGLEFDEYGRGKGRKEWSSYVCLQARRRIKITHETWKHIPDDEKDNDWLDIMLINNVQHAYNSTTCLIYKQNLVVINTQSLIYINI